MKFITLITTATLFVAAFALPSPMGKGSALEACTENSGVCAAFVLSSPEGDESDLKGRENVGEGATPELPSLERDEPELEARQVSGNSCGSRGHARPFYRLFNGPVTNPDHLYTFNRAVSGYNFDGVSSYIFPTRQPGTVPFYRLYSPQATNHFYTISRSERNSAIGQGYNWEGTSGYIYPNNNCGGVPFYRLYSPSQTDHFYTTSRSEARSAIATGYNYEGIAGYVYRS